jgi:hypothetical protein
VIHIDLQTAASCNCFARQKAFPARWSWHR